MKKSQDENSNSEKDNSFVIEKEEQANVSPANDNVHKEEEEDMKEERSGTILIPPSFSAVEGEVKTIEFE